MPRLQCLCSRAFPSVRGVTVAFGEAAKSLRRRERSKSART
jgi:hypothetical protein